MDLTENTCCIFPFILSMVHQCQAELHLLHVTLDMEQFGGLYDLTALQTDFLGARPRPSWRSSASVSWPSCRGSS